MILEMIVNLFQIGSQYMFVTITNWNTELTGMQRMADMKKEKKNMGSTEYCTGKTKK